MFNVTCVPNILTKRGIASRAEPPGRPAAEYAPSWYDPARCIVELNARRLGPSEALETITQGGDDLYFAVLPDGPLVGGVVGLVMLSIEKLGIATTITLGLGLASVLCNAFGVFAASIGDTSDFESPETPVYSGVQTSAGSGQVIPAILGKVRAGGHIIETYTAPQWNETPATANGVTKVPEIERLAFSRHALQTLVCYCHGPVESVSGLQVDDTDILNIAGAMYEILYGTNIESAPQLFDTENSAIEEVVDSGYITVAGGPASDTTDVECNRVAIHIAFPNGLYTVSDRGDIHSREVEIGVRHREAGGSYGDQTSYHATGSSRGYLSYWILLDVLGDLAEYEVEVERLTADNAAPEIEDRLEWETRICYRPGSSAHPGLAKIAYSQIPQQRQAVPRKYTALFEGSSDIRVYTDSTTYTEEYTNNPAWCLLYWICNPTFGLGKWYGYGDVEDIDEWIEAADWCDELIYDGGAAGPHGLYTTEKRCTFNMELRSSMSSSEILRAFAESCGLWAIEQAGKWRIVVDRDEDIVMAFTEGNYKEDSLQYVWMGTQDQPTRLTGRFLDADRDYEENIVPIAYEAVPAGEHYIEQTIDLRGVTSISQAVRRLHTIVRATQMNNRLVRFTAGVAALTLRAGDLFSLASRSAGVGLGSGRILKCTHANQELYLDSPVVLDSAKDYEITVCHVRDKSVDVKALTVWISEATDIVTVSDPSAWANPPEPGDLYSVGLEGDSTRKFRCVTKKTKEDFTHDIIGVLHDPDVYDFEYNCENLPDAKTYFNPDKIPSPVENVTAEVREPYDSTGVYFFNEIDVSWTLPAGSGPVSHFEIYHKRSGDNIGWHEPVITTGTTGTILGHVYSGPFVDYKIRVLPITHTGKTHSLDDAEEVELTT